MPRPATQTNRKTMPLRAGVGHRRSLPIRDRKRRIIFTPAYAAPQTRRRQAAIVARDPNFIKRPHSAGAQRPLSPRAIIQRSENPRVRPAAFGRGCVKTQNRPLEIVSKLGEFSVEVSCLLTGRYRLVSQSIASHVVFEGDFWGETVAEF